MRCLLVRFDDLSAVRVNLLLLSSG